MKRARETVVDFLLLVGYGIGAWWIAHQVPWWGAALIAPTYVFTYFFFLGIVLEMRKIRAARRTLAHQLAHAIVLATLRSRR